MDRKDYSKAIKELQKFREEIEKYDRNTKALPRAERSSQELAIRMKYLTKKLRERINNKIPIVSYYLKEVGLSTDYIYVSAPAAGGRAFPISLLNDIFNFPPYSGINISTTIDIIDRGIGFYKYLVKSKKTIVELQEAPLLDIINLIEKNLRRSFRKLPQNEIEVQDHIETILNARDIKFSRDKVSFEYSSKSYKPDFIIEDLESVVEVKFSNSKKDESKIIAEINDDIVAYKTKYKILIFIIYDLGIIIDEYKFKDDITDNHNVYVKVIKH